MSETMAEKKKMEEEARKKEVEALTQDLKDAKDDKCPYCLQPVTSMPYINFHPVMGWLECAACGIIFSPMSVRNIKLRKAKSNIEVSKPSLLVPAGMQSSPKLVE